MACETTPAPREERTAPARNVDPFDALRGEMNALFDGFFGRGFPSLVRRPEGAITRHVVPRMDVRETDKELAIKLELPGLDEKDVSVTLQDGMLTIKGEKSFEQKDEDENYHVMERRYASFQRSASSPRYGRGWGRRGPLRQRRADRADAQARGCGKMCRELGFSAEAEPVGICPPRQSRRSRPF